MSEQTLEQRMEKTASKMRGVFFAEFGDPNQMDEQTMYEALRCLIALHLGAVCEFAARFKKPDITLRDQAIQMIDVMLETNADVFADIMGDRDVKACLTGSHRLGE